jgi:hypothetical protein
MASLRIEPRTPQSSAESLFYPLVGAARLANDMSLNHKVKTALDENRLLVLGAQVLFGFQFQGVFQDAFSELPSVARGMNSLALTLMALTIGLLIVPSMQHRIVEGGADTNRIHRVAGLFAGAALLPFGMSLGLDIFIVVDHLFGALAATIAGSLICALAAVLWFIIGFVLRLRLKVSAMAEKEEPTPLPARIEQMLTQARVILPGAQALLGFQLAVTFTRSFGELDIASRLVHMAALCFVVLAVLLLMTPAALHRIAFRGQDTETFLTLGSGFVLAAPIALALGLAGDMQVAITRATDTHGPARIIAAASFAALMCFWYGVPLLLRMRKGPKRKRQP